MKNLSIEQGATFAFAFTYYQPGPVVNGEVTPGDPWDLTGCFVAMQIRKRYGRPPIVTAHSGTTGDGAGRIVLGGTAGTIVVTLTDEDTDQIAILEAVYDLELTWPAQSGDLRPRVERLLQGTVATNLNITRDA